MVRMTAGTEPIQIAFVCVQNAGRSQMASALARRELAERQRENEVSVITGGTQPAEAIHSEVLAAMDDIGVDIKSRDPREITSDELRSSDYVITMGCSDENLCPAGWHGNSRTWDLADPEGRSPSEVASIRDEIERRVERLCDELLHP